jgi:hypothetical protein
MPNAIVWSGDFRQHKTKREGGNQPGTLIPDGAEKNSVLTLRSGTDGHGSFVGALPALRLDFYRKIRRHRGAAAPRRR